MKRNEAIEVLKLLHASEDDEVIKKAVGIAVEALENQEAHEWIPCSARTPARKITKKNNAGDEEEFLTLESEIVLVRDQEGRIGLAQYLSVFSDELKDWEEASWYVMEVSELECADSEHICSWMSLL